MKFLGTRLGLLHPAIMSATPRMRVCNARVQGIRSAKEMCKKQITEKSSQKGLYYLSRDENYFYETRF